MRDKKENDDNPIGLIIPIVVLLLVLIFTQVVWILIPIIILLVVFIDGVAKSRQIKSQEETMKPISVDESGSYTSGKVPLREEDTKPIYDKKKQKEDEITCGTFIPILIVLWLFFSSLSWIFLIPLFFLLVSLFQTILNRIRGREEVKEAITRGDAGTIQDIADSTGYPEERVRRHIVREKRSGTTDVWFDPNTGTMASRPVASPEVTSTKKGCVYCGFALKDDDRFCPYCGAPIMVKDY